MSDMPSVDSEGFILDLSALTEGFEVMPIQLLDLLEEPQKM